MSAPASTAPPTPTPAGSCVSRPRSPSPRPSITAPSTTTRTSPDTSSAVMTRLARSDSRIPRALSSATSVRKTSAAGTGGTSRNCPRQSPAKASARPAALVTPAASIANPTRNASSGRPKARSANTAEPPARGYLVTSSA